MNKKDELQRTLSAAQQREQRRAEVAKDALPGQVVGLVVTILLVWWGTDWDSTAFWVGVCAAAFWLALAESETH